MSLKLNKYFCKGCEINIFPTNEYIRKCGDCGSTLLEKQEITPEDYMLFVQQELEWANHHDYIELPEKLYKSLIERPHGSLDIHPEEKLKIAKIICESFYENI